MTGVKKLAAREVFDESMSDANRLLMLARALTNKRTYKLRTEMRQALAPALEKLRVSKADWDEIDGIESDDLFVMLLPSASLGKDDFRDHSPLLRGALVAGCSAFETFLYEWATMRIRKIPKKVGLPPKAQKITMTVERWAVVHESKYPRRTIVDRVIAPYLAEQSSTAPNKVGEVMSTVGIDRPLQRIDSARKVKKGTSETQLQDITRRRNRIAHAADRKGRRKATLGPSDTEQYLAWLVHIVDAIEVL